MTSPQDRWLRRLSHIAPAFYWQYGTRGDNSSAIRGVAKDDGLLVCPITATCKPPLQCVNVEQASLTQMIPPKVAAAIVLASDGFGKDFDMDLRAKIIKAVKLSARWGV